jgi:hypothetical protein
MMTEEMRQLIYCMHFKGQSSPATNEPRRIRATSSATSCTVRTTVSPEGVAGSLEAAEGDLAFLEAEMHLTGAHTFSETGTITFGDQHVLRVTSAYEGHLGPSSVAQTVAGTVTWSVEGGEGQFANAHGQITSNFTLSESGEVNDYHFGVLFLP